jgi:hypothetical protein
VSVRARLGGPFRVDAGLLVAVIRRGRRGRMWLEGSKQLS